MAPLLAQRGRSDRAFEKLYQRHVGDVYRYALVVMRNQADAEDVTQTTFLNAYRAFARGERPQTPQNWLIAIAHNVCRQRFRQLQRRPNELPLEDEDAAQTVPDDDDAPSAEDIRRALSHLAFNQRAAIVMRELEGRSYAEIAEVLNLSTSAVETLIFRARRALREQLEGGLTCREAEFAISRQLDGRLPRRDKGSLRAHLRECEDCARFARSQRAQRSAIRSLALIPIPSSLSSFFHHGGAATGTAAAGAAGGGVAVKAALVGATAIVATGAGVEVAHKAHLHPLRSEPHAAAAAAKPKATHAAAVSAPRLTAVGNRAAATKKHEVKHGRIAAEQPTKNLAGRLREEAPTTDRTAAIAGAKPAHPAHPVHPAHPAHPAHPVKKAHPAHPVNNGQTKQAEKPKQHKPVTPPPPPAPTHDKKPHDETVTSPSVALPPPAQGHGKP
jgi:RNA polymerase sigma-70 factor (ECF subfamily)